MSTETTAEDILGLVTSSDYVQVATQRLFLAPQSLLDEHTALQHAYDKARLSNAAQSIDNAELVNIAEQLGDLEERLDGFMREFRFKALPRKAYADLLAKHAPTGRQKKDEPSLAYNPDTFPVVLIAACLTSPKMTVEQVQVLEQGEDGVGGLNDAQFTALFNTAVSVNVGGLSAPKSVAGGVARHMRNASEQPPTTTGSPDQSSLDG